MHNIYLMELMIVLQKSMSRNSDFSALKGILIVQSRESITSSQQSIIGSGAESQVTAHYFLSVVGPH